MERTERSVAAMCAIAGSLLLLTGTYLHPVPADPNDAVQALAAYARDRFWVPSDLMQLVGAILALASLLIVARQLQRRTATVWSHLASAGAIASIALTAALQAVDGIALRVMVQNWATAAITQKPIAFQSAFAVRQLEIGLASVLSILLGATATLYGVALARQSHVSPVVGCPRDRRRRANIALRVRNGVQRFLGAGNGDQYARQSHTRGLGDDAGILSLAPRIVGTIKPTLP